MSWCRTGYDDWNIIFAELDRLVTEDAEKMPVLKSEGSTQTRPVY